MKHRMLVVLAASLVLVLLLVTWSKTRPTLAPSQHPAAASSTQDGRARFTARSAWTRQPLPTLQVLPSPHPANVESNHTLALHHAGFLEQHPLSKPAVQSLTTDLLLWDAILLSHDPSDEGVVAKAATLGLPETDVRLLLDACFECKDYEEFLKRAWEGEDLAKVRDRLNSLGFQVPPEIMIEANKFCAFNTWYEGFMHRQASEMLGPILPGDAVDSKEAQAILLEKDSILASVSTFFRERWQARYGIPPDQAVALVEALKTVQASDFHPMAMSFPRIKSR